MYDEFLDLKQLAAQCRDLAAGCDDPVPREKLLELAAEYDPEAARISRLIMPNPEWYISFYNPGDHAAVSEAALRLERTSILTCDNMREISHPYKARRQFGFDVN